METRKRILFIFIFAALFLGNTGHFMLPQVFTNWQQRHPDSATNAHLHNLYLACHAYWSDEGSSATCTVKKASLDKYSFIQSKGVMIHGSGTKNKFCAVAWHQDTSHISSIDSAGQIKEQSEIFIDKNIFTIDPPNKIWIYEEILPRHFVYYSFVLILPLMMVILTSWAGGYTILRKKRKFPKLISIGVITGWLLIALITSGFAGDDYSYLAGFGDSFAGFLCIPVIFSISRASSLIGWGKQIQSGIDLPGYLENHDAKKLKKSGIYLLVAFGSVLILPYMYCEINDKYKEQYFNQSVKFMNEIEKVVQADPSRLQLLCQPSLKTP